jgi:hypothetical protein
MLKKEYITVNAINSKTTLKDNTIVTTGSSKELEKAIQLTKKCNRKIKAIQTNSKIINNLNNELFIEFKKTFKYVSIIYNESLNHKLSNQNNFIEIFVDYNQYIKDKNSIINNSPNRIILDFTNSIVSKEILNNELNELIINKIFPLTKGLPLDYTMPEHLHELYTKTLTIDEINKSNLDNKTKLDIIKFLDNSKAKNNTKEENNERFINRI